MNIQLRTILAVISILGTCCNAVWLLTVAPAKLPYNVVDTAIAFEVLLISAIGMVAFFPRTSKAFTASKAAPRNTGKSSTAG
jgi:hypothetical protein